MRALLITASLLALACGHEAPASAPAAPEIDRTPGERPAGTLVELSVDGGDEALTGIVSQLPAGPFRSAIPTRVSVLLDGLIELPGPIAEHVDGGSPIRLLMARIDGELRSAVAVRLDAPLDTHPGGGPRGTDGYGAHAAVDDRIAVVSDDASLLEAAFPYLAYGALAEPSAQGVIVLRVPSSTIRTIVRTALEHAVDERRAGALDSIRSARAEQGRPPELGDPEPIVTALADTALARIAYLPDLGDATVRLEPTSSGLALTMEADVTGGSPLAAALAGHASVAPTFIASMPTSSLLVLATGTRADARATTENDLVTTLATVAAARMPESERAGLEHVAEGVATIRGDEGALALGVEDGAGAFVVTATRSANELAIPAAWGRAFPWTTQLLGALFLCTPVAPGTTPEGATLCDEVALARRVASGIRVDAIAHHAAAMIADLPGAIARDATAASPDLARDLAALPGSTFAALVVRPLRMLPVMSLFGGPGVGLPRGDGAFVLALAHESGRLTVALRASRAAMADLDTLQRLFANGSDSE